MNVYLNLTITLSTLEAISRFEPRPNAIVVNAGLQNPPQSGWVALAGNAQYGEAEQSNATPGMERRRTCSRQDVRVFDVGDGSTELIWLRRSEAGERMSEERTLWGIHLEWDKSTSGDYPNDIAIGASWAT